MHATLTRSPRLALLATSLGFAIICLDVTVVNVALERIRFALAVDPAHLGWVLNAYALAFASLLLSAGALGDRFGARRVFTCGFAVFTLASVACGIAPDAAALIAARTAQGIGAALCVPSSLALLRLIFPDAASRAKAVSIWAGTAALALGAGPIVGGLLISSLGWRSIFLINVPVGIIGIWLTIRHVPDSTPDAARRIDFVGQLLAVVSLVALTVAVMATGDRGWTNATTVAGMACFIVTGLLFVFVEKRQQQPMLPLSLFRIPAVNVSSLTGLALNFGYYGLMFAISLFFQSVWKFSALQAGLAFVPMTAVVTVANLVSGALTARFGYRMPMIAGQVLAAVGLLSLALIERTTSYLLVACPLIAIGVGVALAVPSINTALLDHVEKSLTGVASGVLNTARQIGGVLGVGVFGALVVGPEGEMIAGLHIAVALAATVMLASAAIAAVGLKPQRIILKNCAMNRM